MDGSSSVVAGKSVEAHSFVYDTLASKGSITVQQHAHGGTGFLLVVVVVQDGAGLAKYDWVFGLQVRRIGNQRQLNTLSRRCRALEVHSQVVLDVTRSLIGGFSATGEFAEDGLVGFPDDVGQDVEASTMGHTNDDVLDAIIDTAIDQSLHTRDQTLSALKAETLVVGVLCGQESLEVGTPDQTVQDAALLVDRVLERLGHLDALTEPIALLPVRDVDVLDTVGSAVEALASGDDLPQGHLGAVLCPEARQDTGAELDLLVQVLLGEVVVGELELAGLAVAELLGLCADAERVDARLVVATRLVCAHQQLDLQVVHDVGALARPHAEAGPDIRNSRAGGGDDRGGRLKGLRGGHFAGLHVAEVDLPRDVDARGLALPLHVHLVDIVGRVAAQEAVVGVLCGHG